MKVNEAAKKLNLKCFVQGKDREIKGGYVGDLLSWVIGRAGEGSAWITIMSNVNVLAVALLADVSMIILAEGVLPDEDLIKKAEEQEIGLYQSPSGSFEISWKLHELLAK